MTTLQEADRKICDVSLSTKCTSVTHRQIRELKSRWQMRWAALEETIPRECEKHGELQQILSHIVCKAKSSGKSRRRNNDGPDWMENRISVLLVRAFLRTIWPNPECVDMLDCEFLTLDSYYGHKLKYLSLIENGLEPESTASESHVPVSDIQGSVSHDGDLLASPPERPAGSTSTSQHAREDEESSTAIDDPEVANHDDAEPPAEDRYMQPSLALNSTGDKSSITSEVPASTRPSTVLKSNPVKLSEEADDALHAGKSGPPKRIPNVRESSTRFATANNYDVPLPVPLPESPSSWYTLPPDTRHHLRGCYPWGDILKENGSLPPRSLKGLVDVSNADPPGASPGWYRSWLDPCSIGTVVAGDYRIQEISRTEQNFIVYSATALFHGYGTYLLTAIRNPQDCVGMTRDKSIKLCSKLHNFGKNKQKKRVASYTSLNEHDKGLVDGLLVYHKTTAISTRKYIIKLIKKRQASNSYLHTFKCDGLIWIVQGQEPHDVQSDFEQHDSSPERPRAQMQAIGIGRDLGAEDCEDLSGKRTDPINQHLSQEKDKEQKSVDLHLKSKGSKRWTNKPRKPPSRKMSVTDQAERRSGKGGRQNALGHDDVKSPRSDADVPWITTASEGQIEKEQDVTLPERLSGRQTLKLSQSGKDVGIWYKRNIDVFIKGDILQSVSSPEESQE